MSVDLLILVNIRISDLTTSVDGKQEQICAMFLFGTGADRCQFAVCIASPFRGSPIRLQMENDVLINITLHALRSYGMMCFGDSKKTRTIGPFTRYFY